MEQQSKSPNKIGIIICVAVAIILVIAAILILINQHKKNNPNIVNRDKIVDEGKAENGKADNGKGEKAVIGDDMAAVYQIELSIISPMENHINYVRYPYYYQILSENNDLVYFDLDSKTKHYIPKDDLDFFLDFIEKYDNSDNRTDDSVLTYCFSVTCYEDGPDSEILSAKSVYGYDIFPEDLYEVIDRLNKLCNEELLEHPTDVVYDIPDFVYQELGVSEADYPREDIEKMADLYGVNTMNRMVSETNGFEGLMSGYNASISDGKIEQYIPHELREAKKISDEEYTDFVNKYVKELGDGWELSFGIDQDGLTMIRKDGDQRNGYMYIGKAELVSKWNQDGDIEHHEYNGYDDEFVYMMPVGPEDMSKSSDFLYNEDASVVLVDYNLTGMHYDEYVEIFYNLK